LPEQAIRRARLPDKHRDVGRQFVQAGDRPGQRPAGNKVESKNADGRRGKDGTDVLECHGPNSNYYGPIPTHSYNFDMDKLIK